MHQPPKPGTRESRTFELTRSAVDVDKRTVSLAFSSEEPYDRYWGREILDHSRGAIRLSRLKAGGPLLVDHDSRDIVGVIESVTIGADRVGRAVVRFGRSPRAEEVFADVVDGIRRSVSVGYQIHKAQLVETGEDGVDVYRVTDWEPFEVSLVAVPADASVGVGRSEGIQIVHTEEHQSPSQRLSGAGEVRKSVATIIAMGTKFKPHGGEDVVRDFLASGRTDVQEFTQILLKHIETKPAPIVGLGMSSKEQQEYSFLRAINALANPQDRNAQEAAAFEFEASRAWGQKIGKRSRGIMVPADILTRDLTVGTATAGGHTVATDLLAGNFIDLLRNAMVLSVLGIRTLTGLQGNVAIPRQTAGATAYWVAESGAPSESAPAFDQVTMAPRTVGAYVDVSRKLLLQSSIDMEAFVRRDLATSLGLEIERVALNGSGSGQEPTGILNTSGIGSVAGGTNGLAPTFAHMVALETAVAVANAAVANLGYLANSKVRGKLKTTEKVASTGAFVWDDGDKINGYRSTITNAVPSNLTKGTSSGVCSAILFGNWGDLLLGLWGGLDLMTDPYSMSTSGTVRVVALQDVDVALRHAESFAAMKDALTT